MATNPSCVSYEQDEHTNFFLCRQCRTHMALHQELIHKYAMESCHALFKNLVNVNLAENHRILSGQHAALAYCITCDSNVGQKFIALKFQTSAIRNGTFLVDMKKLLLWKGNQMVYADTEKPVENA